MKAVPANRYATFALLAIVGCVVDLATKSWIFAKLGMPQRDPENHKVIWLWENVFGFQTSLNEGALFGIGQGQVVFFATLSIVAAIGIVYWLFWVGAAEDRLLTVALGCVTGGVFGNLYDRLGMPGLAWDAPSLLLTRRIHAVGDPVYAVRDWLHFKIEALDYVWPTFNIADSLLVVGAAMLVLHAFTHSPTTDSATDKPSPKELDL